MQRNVPAPLLLAGSLWWGFRPQLALLVLIGVAVNDQLLLAAVHLGFVDHALALNVLTPVVLAKLVVTVVMCLVMRPALPAMAAARAVSQGTAVPLRRTASRMRADQCHPAAGMDRTRHSRRGAGSASARHRQSGLRPGARVGHLRRRLRRRPA
jgi:hypothetical protein